jgi:hypothetical protein
MGLHVATPSSVLNGPESACYVLALWLEADRAQLTRAHRIVPTPERFLVRALQVSEPL